MSSSSSRWLLKSEPSDYSIADMEREGTTVWDGVRNPTARKNLRAMRVGDRALFYHSSAGSRTGVAGVVTVCKPAYPDPADAAWAVVDVQFDEIWPEVVTLEALKQHRDGALAGMALFKAPRLSVQPVSEAHWTFVCEAMRQQQQPPPAEQSAEKGTSSKKRRLSS